MKDRRLPLLFLALFGLFLTINPAKAVQIAWDNTPGKVIYEYKIWKRDANGVDSLIGVSKDSNYDLGPLTQTTSVCVSAVSSFYSLTGEQEKGVEGPKSAVMVVAPDAGAGEVLYVSFGNVIFADNKSTPRHFFRFDIQGDSAIVQDSFDLVEWRSITKVSVVGLNAQPIIK